MPDSQAEVPRTVAEYMAGLDPQTRVFAEQIRGALRLALPVAQERIKWGMPTFWQGSDIIAFACFNRHISLFPGSRALEHFAPRLNGFVHSKGTLQLPYSSDFPLHLVTEIAKWCYEDAKGENVTTPEVLAELAALGSERTKRLYLGQGAREPVFGVATGAMKPLLKRIKINQPLAEELYATGIYDAMYFAGMIADASAMQKSDFDRWMQGAYYYAISDFVVAVTLSESTIAQEVADAWIADGRELYQSAGYSCYCWLLGSRQDHEFDETKLASMLDLVAQNIHHSPDRAKYAMNNFVMTTGVSFVGLHTQALAVARKIGEVVITKKGKSETLAVAATEIEVAVGAGRLGFKRQHVRC